MQTEAAFLLIPTSSHNFEWKNTVDLNDPEGVGAYSKLILEQGRPGDPLLAPYAFLAIIYTEDQQEQISIKERFLSSINSENLNDWATEMASVYWLISAADVAIWGYHDNSSW